ncbi:hypothetical protein KV112_19020 [Mycolicibacter sp. MYC123]|uniref:Uncharacterized protein n=1 Tax=[Mycobacterium] zoologicum TaxID=2872311 RepID=A0ABU5YP17_9MYCO|nr:hypothetical protein [Mycolicibacter sp. MYC123]MEB3051807.1 hypothetical protein [Mycolicibacter sp. MYC123]
MTSRQLTEEERHAVALMKGLPPADPNNLASPLNGMGIRAYLVLSGSPDLRVIAAQITRQRESLLQRMVLRQTRRVERIRTIRWASRVWVVQRRLSRFEVAARGIGWLLLHTLHEIAAIVSAYSTKLGVAAVFLSSPYWLFVKDQNGSGLAADDVMGFLTKLVLPGLSLWAMGILLFRMAVSRFGPPRNWQWALVIKIVLLMAVIDSLMAGAWLLGKKLQLSGLVHVDPKGPMTIRVVGVLVLAFWIFLVGSMACSAIDQTLLKSERVKALAVSLTLLTFPVMGFVGSRTVTPSIRVGLIATSVVLLLLWLIGFVYRIGEWFERYTSLVRQGVDVPRRGFSRRLLGAWLLSVALVPIGLIPADATNNAVQLALIAPMMLALLGAFVVLPITARFVRRVNVYFEQHETAKWSDYAAAVTSDVESVGAVSAESRSVSESSDTQGGEA